jgi:Holliday junction DNA helicase RuvA
VIGRLTGRVAAQEADGAIVVDVGGVGYEVFVPLGSAGRALDENDGRVTLYVHTHVREEAFTLFGFATETDRAAFRTLIGVSNVGPKTALAVLSALPAGELARTIAQKDLGKLTRIPGIGKKTAERLVLELRDKLPVTTSDATSPAAGARGPGPSHAGARDLLLSALTRMGYRPSEADRAIDALADKVERDPLPDLVREALALLAK